MQTLYFYLIFEYWLVAWILSEDIIPPIAWDTNTSYIEFIA